MSGFLLRPIYGGAFGDGRFSLATTPHVENGLHAVRFFVVDPKSGHVLSAGATKRDVLAAARHVLRRAGEAANDEKWLQVELFQRQAEEVRQPAGRKVSRRRRGVYERSGGRCCYCSEPLQLAGPWHIEHQVPRALDGDDGPLNLVAACRACNLRKGARSALEFVAENP